MFFDKINKDITSNDITPFDADDSTKDAQLESKYCKRFDA